MDMQEIQARQSRNVSIYEVFFSAVSISPPDFVSSMFVLESTIRFEESIYARLYSGVAK
jgi:hypothetical protein